MFRESAGGGGMNTGKVFIPYKLFIGSFIPNAIMRNPDLTPLEKLTWARLAQFSGENGDCRPSLSLLATELGTSKRSIVNAIDGLVKKKFIKRIRASKKEQITKHIRNNYKFLWHNCLEESLASKASPDDSGGQVKKFHQAGEKISPGQVKKLHTKENHIRESEKTTTQASGCGEDDFKSKGKEARLLELSAKQKNYIKYKLSWTKEAGKIRQTAGDYKSGLEKSARAGSLDMTDYAELENSYFAKLASDYTQETMSSWSAEQAGREIRQYLGSPWSTKQVTYRGESFELHGATWIHYLEKYHPEIYRRITESEYQEYEGRRIEAERRKKLEQDKINLKNLCLAPNVSTEKRLRRLSQLAQYDPGLAQEIEQNLRDQGYELVVY